MRSPIDSRLTARLAYKFDDQVSIQAKKYTISASNQKTVSGFTPIDGLDSLPCLIGPIIESRPTDEEIRTGHIKELVRRRHVLMSGYFPQILRESMVAITSEATYEIRGVEADSQTMLTRLRLEEIKP